jgi:PQQ-dependent dehydrogenase (methanol/ethanol family)
VWGWVSYDPTLDLLFYGTSNPGPWNPEQRPGDNKWTCGVFARKPDTGEAVWFYQWSPHDLYDHDGINENIVAELTVDGAPRHVLIHPGRTGYIYVVDRGTGEVLSATPFGHITTSQGVDLKTGRLIPVEGKEVKAGKRVTDICPAAPGTKDWSPSAYVPSTGILYIPANNLCEEIEAAEVNYIAGTPYIGADVRMYAGPGGHRGELIAWDVAQKRELFRVKEKFPVMSGVVATAGGLVFYGTMDGWFKALDAKTGAVLWSQRLGSGIIGQPITFRGPDGKQYVSILAGVGGWLGVVVSADLDPRDPTAAAGTVGAVTDLPQHTTKGGTLYTFALP